MSPLSAYIAARLRKDDSSPQTTAADSDIGDDDDIFGLLPPEVTTPRASDDAASHRIGITDLGRLSVDHDNRLYWDDKPVEVHQRIVMSRAQLIGAGIVLAFVVIGALGSALQGATTARDWACRFGWLAGVCAAPRSHADIPA